MCDLARQNLPRVTVDPAVAQYPVWMPDGKRLLFASDRGGATQNIYGQVADGTPLVSGPGKAASTSL
jgi:Tol biopolymer transport system component